MAAVAPLNSTSFDAKPPLNMGVRLRLSVMMLLQFGVWGAWFMVLNIYLTEKLKFDNTQVGSIYGAVPLGAMFAMMFAGQLADRLMSSEYLMAIFHLGGAAMLYIMAQQESFAAVWWTTFAWALLYNPTLAISNSIAFANIPDATRDFPTLRVLGTIGWIAAASSVDWLLPGATSVVDGVTTSVAAAATNQPILLGAGLSVALGLFSLLLPHTPPAGQGGGAFPFLKAVALLRDPSFAIFFGLAFAITIALAFYYTWTGVFLGSMGVEKPSSMMTIGQWSEIGFMLLLPLSLRWLGMKTVLAIGMAAWVLRYGLFAGAADGTPFALVILGIALHGVCFDFFLAAGFIHTDNKAPVAIRGSAQALFSFLVYGVGMYIGSEVSGRVVAAYSTGEVRQWSSIWLVPAIAAAVCLVLFLLFWRDKSGKVDDQSSGEIQVKAGPAEPVAAVGDMV